MVIMRMAMDEREYVDILIEEICQELLNQPRPKVTRNDHKKTISATYYYNFPYLIPATIIAPRKKWVNWINELGNFEKVSFDDIEIYLSKNTPIKTIEYLKPLIIKGRYEGRGDKLFE